MRNLLGGEGMSERIAMSTQLDIDERMTIGELAKRASIPASKIHYYEKVGVLPRSQRTDSNYRV